MEKAVVTCALTGILTDPADYPAPVTPEEMAREAKRAFDEGASVVHVHFRRLEPGIMATGPRGTPRSPERSSRRSATLVPESSSTRRPG